MSTLNTFVNEPNRVIIYDDFGEEVIHEGLGYSSHEDRAKAFLELFEPIEGTHLAAEDYYRGITVMSVIKRKSDGRLFGFSWWKDISKHGDSQPESNGDENGLEFEVPDGFDWNNGYYPSPYVFLPIEPFTITGYKTITNEGTN